MTEQELILQAKERKTMECKYKPGDKFILEITEPDYDAFLRCVPGPAYLVKGLPGPFSEGALDKLEHIEPQMAAGLTNADKIRNMPLDDLAMMIMCSYDTAGESEEIMPCVQAGDDPEITKKCYECCKAWLMKEATNGQT